MGSVDKLLVGLMVMSVVLIKAYADPDLLQDICVADLTSGKSFYFFSVIFFLLTRRLMF